MLEMCQRSHQTHYIEVVDVSMKPIDLGELGEVLGTTEDEISFSDALIPIAYSHKYLQTPAPPACIPLAYCNPYIE